MATNLTEEHRLKLDGIVSQMIANQEPEENIQWVVNDFKQKYGGTAPGSQPAKPQTTDLDNVPEWGRKNPTAYGAAGAIGEAAKPILEALGLVGGGAKGAAVGALAGGVGVIPGAVAGSGLGYAAARRINQAIDLALGNKRPETVGQGFANTARDVVEGGAMEATGQIGGKLLTKALARKPKPVTAERQVISDILQAQGGKGLTPAELTGETKWQYLESGLEKNLSSAGKVRSYRQSNLDALNKMKGNIVEEQGGFLDPTTAGAVTQEVGNKNMQAWKEIRNSVYKELDDIVPKGELIPTPNTAATAETIAQDMAQGKISKGDLWAIADKLRTPSAIFEKGKAGTKTIEETPDQWWTPIKQWGDYYQEVIKGAKPSEMRPQADITWQGLKSDIETLKGLEHEAWKTGNDSKARIYGILKEAMLKDVSAYSEATGGEFKNVYDFATQVARAGANTFKDKRIMSNVIRNSNPATITKTFIKPNNANNIYTLRSAVGNEGMQPIKQAWLEDLFTKGEEQAFSPAKFATAWDKYDKKTLLSFLKGDEYNKLDQLAKASRVLQEVEKKAGNPSGTARLADMLTTGYMAVAHPIITATKMIAANRLAELYLNNSTFRNYLVNGLKVPATTETANIMATKLMTLAGVDPNKANVYEPDNSTNPDFDPIEFLFQRGNAEANQGKY